MSDLYNPSENDRIIVQGLVKNIKESSRIASLATSKNGFP